MLQSKDAGLACMGAGHTLRLGVPDIPSMPVPAGNDAQVAQVCCWLWGVCFCGRYTRKMQSGMYERVHSCATCAHVHTCLTAFCGYICHKSKHPTANNKAAVDFTVQLPETRQ